MMRVIVEECGCGAGAGDHKAFAGTRGYPHNMYAGAGRVRSCQCGCGAGADEKSLPAVISDTYVHPT